VCGNGLCVLWSAPHGVAIDVQEPDKGIAVTVDANLDADTLLIVQHGEAGQVAGGADYAPLLERQPHAALPGSADYGAGETRALSSAATRNSSFRIFACRRTWSWTS
jgi:hypothetical protein